MFELGAKCLEHAGTRSVTQAGMYKAADFRAIHGVHPYHIDMPARDFISCTASLSELLQMWRCTGGWPRPLRAASDSQPSEGR